MWKWSLKKKNYFQLLSEQTGDPIGILVTLPDINKFQIYKRLSEAKYYDVVAIRDERDRKREAEYKRRQPPCAVGIACKRDKKVSC